jgi:ATP-dependent Clp protease ATP-binding subunit ClpA
MGIRQRENAPDDRSARERFRESNIAVVKAAFPPELFNRIQRLVCFYPLSREAIRAIIDKILGGLTSQLVDRSLALELDDSAYDLLMAEGYDEACAAREMERAVQRLIAEPLGRLLLAGKAPNGARLRVRAGGSEMAFDRR